MCGKDLLLTFYILGASLLLVLYVGQHGPSERLWRVCWRAKGSRPASGSHHASRSQVLVRCPFCKEDHDKVVDSRSSEGGRVVRRRRLCLACKRRYTTYERVEEPVKLTVIKKDGSRVPYDRGRIIAGVQKACYKRPVSLEQMERLAEEVEEAIFRQQGQEVTSRFIGEETIKRLKGLDKVAYVRYASVYREFADLDQFINEAQELMRQSPEEAGQKRLFEG